METVNGGSLGEDKGGPPPPSPLTGCYLLVVIGEPHSEVHKDIILQKVAKGLLSWNVNDCLVDLEKELAIITEQGLEGEEARYGERLIQFASENLVTEILIHPAVSTLSQCVRNLLSSFTRHRHIIHAGYTFQANGSWALQDGTFSYSDFAEAFQEMEVQRVIHAYENGISIDLHCTPEGDWIRLPKEFFTKFAKVRVNPTDVLTTGSPSITSFTKYLEPFLVPSVLEDILESSDVVGNIRFSRPTLYVFPGGQGDAALFGINGFNMLLDGGYSRKACFWDFVRHLDRLDAVLMTRLNNSSLSGVSSVLKRKKQGAIYPQLGHFFCNIQERKSLLSPDGDKDKDPLIISLLEEGQTIIQDLHHLNLNPQSCYRDSEPIILYHKVGHGTLNMFVLSPDKNSRDVREFLQRWHQSDSKLFAAAKTGKEFAFPLQNLVSICALLVWQPANPDDTITRILYPGSTPQKKIFDGLDRLKSLECMKHPVCTVKSVLPVKKTKQDILDKLTAKAPTEKKIENKVLMENSNKTNGEMNGDVINKDKPVKKSDSLETEKEKKPKKAEESKIIENGEKPKARVTKTKPRAESQPRKKPTAEKKGPPTPKKTIENKTNGETKAALKPSPSATPAKSTKDANNRKVIESKKAPVKKEPVPKAAPVEAKPKTERKPISRRPKAIKGPPSPMKKMSNGIQKPDSLSKRGKLDKEGTTDSSTVSTPSADQESILKKDISKLTPEEFEQLKVKELEELKEEQEAVKEIEAVFRKCETRTEASEPGVRKIKEMSIDDNIDTEEYLIIEKEEVEHDSLDQNEDEMQKLVRDSEESEKQRKLSGEEEKLKIEAQEQKIVEVEEPTKTPELDSKKPEADKKELTEEENKEIVESHPEEKVSANIESGATTTAPTLPEDERITLDEIKEDNGKVVEEKHVKEETKEKEIPIIQLPPKSQHDSQSKPHPVVGISLEKQKHVRDIVKTPDEVADLPVHEEADYQEFQDDKKSNEVTDKEGEKKEEKETDDVENKVKHDETNKEVTEKEKKKDAGDMEHVTKHEEKVKKESEVVEKEGKEEIGNVIKAEGDESIKVHEKDEKQTDSVNRDVEAPKDVAKEIPIDSKLNDSVISSSQKTEEIEKSDILEKADIETNEDAVIVQKETLKESMDEEWVVISKEEEEVAEEADKVLQVTEPTKKDTIVSDFISKEVEHQELTNGPATAKPDFSLPLVPAADFKSEKDIDTTTTDSSSHEIRKGDEVENVSSDKEKDDIQALIAEADKKPMEDTIVDKINEIKESKHEISEIDTKLRDLKKEVSVPAEEVKLDKGGKDLTKIEEPGQPDIKQKLDDITKIDSKLNELKGEKEEVIVAKSTIDEKAEIIEKSTIGTDHAEPAIIEKAEVLVKKSTRSPEHAESVVLPDSSPEDEGPLVLKALDIDKLELGRKSPAEREDDVQLIVASVAEVLKSEAPLEEFANKLPFTQELRETHITTQDSPVVESKIIKPEDIIPPIPEEPHEEEMNGVKEDDESGTVHRMLVTTSSEDGGEEIEICPAGTITFSKSSESSGRSSPEPSQKTQSQKSSIVGTLSDTISTVKQVAEIGGKVEPSSVVHEASQIVESLEEKVDNLKEEIEKSEAKNVDKPHDEKMVKSEEIKSADLATIDIKLQEKIKEVKFIEDVEKEAEIDSGKESPKLDKKDDTEAKTKPESDKDAKIVPELSTGKNAEERKDKIEALPASPKKEMVTAEDKGAEHDELCKEPIGKEELAKATDKKDEEIPSKLKEEEIAKKDSKETLKDFTAEMPEEAATKDTSPKSPDKNLGAIHDSQKKVTDDINKTVDQLEKDVKNAQQDIIEESSKASEGIKVASDAIAETYTEVSDKITGTISGIFDKIEQHVETTTEALENSLQKLDDSLGTHRQSVHGDDSEDGEVPPPKRRQSIIDKTQDFIEKSEQAFEGALSYITTKASSVLDDIIKSDIESNKLSGQSTPESKELKDSTKLSSPYMSDVDVSRKSTPDLKESKESSGKSTPEPKEIAAGATKLDSQKLSQEVSPALSRKSTPEPKEMKEVFPDVKRDPIALHESTVAGHIDASPTLSGKSTPEPEVDSRKASIDSKALKSMSGKSTPEPKDVKNAIIGTDKLSKDDHSDAVSGKASPEPQIEELKRDSLSGKSTPDKKIATKETEDSISDLKKLSQTKSPELSGKSTPELKEAKVEVEDAKKDSKDDSKISAEERVDSSLASPGKSTSVPKEVIVDVKKDTLDSNNELKDAKDDSKKDSSSALSGKSTPESKALVTDITKDSKDSVDLISDSKIVSVEGHIEAPQVLSGKSTPELKEVVADPKKDSEESVKLENALENEKQHPIKVSDTKILSVEDHIDASPVLSGKSTPEPKEVVAVSSAKSIPKPTEAVEDAKKDSKDSVENMKQDPKDLTSDLKISPAEGHIDLPKDLSGKSTPEPKEAGSSKVCQDIKGAVEDTKATEDLIPDSKISSTEGHIDASPALSGKSTPDLKEVVADTEKDSKASVEFKDAKKDCKDLKSDSDILSAEVAGTKSESTLVLKESKYVEHPSEETKDSMKLSEESHIDSTLYENDLGDSKKLVASDHIDAPPADSRKSSESNVVALDKNKEAPIEATKLSDQSPALSGKSTPESKKLSGQSSPSPVHDHIDAKSSESALDRKGSDVESKNDDAEAEQVMATKQERRESIIEAAEEFIEKSEKALGSMFSVIGGAAKSVLDDIWADKEKEDKPIVEKSLEAELVKEKPSISEKTEQLSKCDENKVEKDSGVIGLEKSVDASKNIEKGKSSEKDQLQDEIKVDKDAAETEKKQTFSDDYKVTKETIEKEEKEIEDKVMHLSDTLEKVSELAQSVSFETCHSKTDEVEKKLIEKEEMQIEKETEKLKGNFDDLSKLRESVTFEKCHPPEDYQVDKETVSKVEKKMEDEAAHLSETVEEVTELAKSISFEKCHQSDSIGEKMNQAKSDEAKVDKDVAEKEKSPKSAESKVDKDILEKETASSFGISKEAMDKDEKIIDDKVKRVSESVESLSNLASSVSFDKCTRPEEFKVDKDAIEKQEKKIEAEVSQISGNADDLDEITASVSFDMCKLKDDIKEHKDFVDEKTEKSPKVEAKVEEIIDSNKVEHLKEDKESSSKLETDACKVTINTQPEQISQAKESVVLDDHPISSQTEKCEKESMEKTPSSLKITQECKKLSISDVEISIKTDIDHKDASRSFLDNERAVFCDSTDAKVYIAPKEVEDASDKSSPEIELSGKATPPTQPVSPVVTTDIQKSPSSKLDSGLSEQTETDEEDLSTKSQIAHSQSDLDELDMKMDPMSMSFYGALPEEHEGAVVAPTYLYEITKAKYGADIKLEEEAKKHDDGLMAASFIGDLPSSSTVADKPTKDAVDSWGNPLGLPAPTHLYEVTKAKFSSQSHEVDLMTSSFIGELPTSTQDPMTTSVYFGGEVSDESFDPIASWGKPLGLPSPAPPNNGTPKKEKKLPAYVSAKNKLNEKRAESPSKLKAKKVIPIYVDLTYVPHHGNHYYSYVDFFRRIRARYYVFSGLEPSRQVYDALLEAKQTWDDKELEVTIIPTYDTDILGYWVAENEELLSKFKIDLAPSASRCTINLQDHETSCSAYRLEF